MKAITTLTTALITAGLMSQAFAQTPPPPPPHHGKMPESMRAEFQKRWDAADTDKDGQLSKAEAQAANMRPINKHFEKIDANKDGKVSKEEVQASMRAKHEERMGKHDGKEHHGMKHEGKEHGKGMGFKSPEERKAEMEARFKKADTNNDGGLSKDELKTAGMGRHLDRFEEFDANKDGKVSLEEIHAAIQKHMGKDHRPKQ